MFRQWLRPLFHPQWKADPHSDGFNRALERRTRTILAELEESYDFSTFSLDSFRRLVEEKQKRSIEFVPFCFPSTISGGWLQLADKDFVFYEANVLPLHQVHIQLHELSHMLCGHGAPDLIQESDFQTLQQLFAYVIDQLEYPEQSDDLIGPLLLRSPRTTLQEVEAEHLSELILERVSVQRFQAVLMQPVTFSRIAVEIYEAMGMA